MKNFNKAMSKIEMDENLRSKTIEALSAVEVAESMELAGVEDSFPVKTKVRRFRKYGISLAAVFVLCFIGVGSYMYTTPIGYMDMDTNPAVELSVNRFDRIIDSKAYNKDGKNLLSDVNIKHKQIEDAVKIIFDDLVSDKLLKDAGLLSVSVTADDKSKEKKLQERIDGELSKLIAEYKVNCSYNVVAVDGETKSQANSHHMSAPKYLAINELKEVDETATYDNCRNKTIPEINQRKEECTNEHKQQQTKTQEHKGDSSGNSNKSHNSGSGSGSGNGSSSSGGNDGSSGSGNDGSSGSGSGHSGSGSGSGKGSGSSSGSSGSGSSGSSGGSDGSGSGSGHSGGSSGSSGSSGSGSDHTSGTDSGGGHNYDSGHH